MKWLTNLVEDENQFLSSTIQTFEFPLDGSTPRSDRISRIEDLDEHITRFQHLAQTLGVELETGIGDHIFLIIESARFGGGVFLPLRVGGESLGEGGGGGERRP